MSGRNVSAPSVGSQFWLLGGIRGRAKQMHHPMIASGQMEPILLQLGIKSNTEQFRNAIISVCV